MVSNQHIVNAKKYWTRAGTNLLNRASSSYFALSILLCTLVASLMSLMASLVPTSRMLKCTYWYLPWISVIVLLLCPVGNKTYYYYYYYYYYHQHYCCHYHYYHLAPLLPVWLSWSIDYPSIFFRLMEYTIRLMEYTMRLMEYTLILMDYDIWLQYHSCPRSHNLSKYIRVCYLFSSAADIVSGAYPMPSRPSSVRQPFFQME